MDTRDVLVTETHVIPRDFFHYVEMDLFTPGIRIIYFLWFIYEQLD